MGEQTHAPTLTRDGCHLRLTVTGNKVIAQRFDGDPDAGGRYLGMVSHPAPKTLSEVTAYYELHGWRAAEQGGENTDA